MEGFMNGLTGCVTRRKFLNRIGKASLASMVVTSGAVTSGLVLAGCSGKEDPIAAHKQEVLQFQKTCRPIIDQQLGAEHYDRFCKATLKEYDGFASRIPVLEDSNNKNLFLANAPFMLSTYRALLGEFNLSQKDALDKLLQISNFKHRQKFENPSLVMKFFAPRVARYEFIKDLFLKKFVFKKDEKYGWASEFPQSDAYIAINFTRCGLTDWFRDQGAPEITPIACEGDYIWTRLLTGLKFIRTKTIGNGDKICDFRFVKIENHKA